MARREKGVDRLGEERCEMFSSPGEAQGLDVEDVEELAEAHLLQIQGQPRILDEAVQRRAC